MEASGLEDRMEASGLEEVNASYLHDRRWMYEAGHLNSSRLREGEGDGSRFLTARSAIVILKENQALRKRLAEAEQTCQMFENLAILRVEERDIVTQINVSLAEENVLLKKKTETLEAERDDLLQQILRHVNPF